MKNKQEIESKIREIEDANDDVLTGSLATVKINAPRALQQISAESKLGILHWVIDSQYKSKLKGVDQWNGQKKEG